MAATAETVEQKKLSKADFESDQDVRWCPGCGDYSILAAVQRFLPTLGIEREKFVFVSGIGCSSRFPYYMNTYGFHTIHGRAPAITTGIKLSKPDLSVWMVTGDGDALSIGGNHLLHILRRNLDVNILLFNNRIYGLTKGQYSPTSEVGKVTKSTPHGSADHPVNPIQFALGAEATFVARSLDVDAKHLITILEHASKHKGTSFVEIYQNCNIFNDGAFKHMSEREVRDETQIQLEHGKPLIYGKDKNKGVAVKDLKPVVVEFEAGNEKAAIDAGVLVYDCENTTHAAIISRMSFPEFPVPMGIFYRNLRPTIDELLAKQVEVAKAKSPLDADVNVNLQKLFSAGDTWLVG